MIFRRVQAQAAAQSVKPAFKLSLAVLLCARLSLGAWITEGYETFRKGEFGAGGVNLYVSKGGNVTAVHRFDVNNDGYPDLIFNNTHDLAYTPASSGYDFGSWGRLDPKLTQFAGAGAVRILSADLNGDGFPELIIVRGFDNVTQRQNSWIYWGSRDGWSERFHTELPTPYAQDACIGDWNGDGLPDIVFIGSSGVGVNRSSLYWSGKDGLSYRNRVEFDSPGANGCLAADLDHDGFTDLVVTGSAGHGKVYWGHASGMHLEAGAPLPLDGSTAAATLSGQLVLSTYSGVSLYSLTGRAFRLVRQLPFPNAGRLASADLNHDGVPDLVVTRSNSGRDWQVSSRIYWGALEDGQVRLSDARTADLPGTGAVDVAIGDLDGDGEPDIVLANSRSALSYDVDSYVYWGGGDSYSPARRTSLPTHGVRGVAIQGRQVLFANSVSGRPIGDIDTYIYFGSQGGKYSTENMQRLPTIGGYESCLADLNDDGYTDLVLVGSHEGDSGGSAGTYIYWGAKGGLSAKRRSEIPTHGAIGCAIGDLNRDGYLDLIFSNMDPDGVQIFFGGPGGFDAQRQTSWPVAQPRFPAVADLNRDGYLDLLVPSVKDGLLIYWGSSAGHDPKRFVRLDGTGTVSEQVADLNGDGYLDIVVCNLMDPNKSLYHGIHSSIYWGSPAGYSTLRRSELPSSGAHHAVVADFNRDGHLDIFISNYQSEFSRTLDSSVYWGSADANYTPARSLKLPNESAAGVVAADLNGDGWVDLAVSNHVLNGDHHALSLIFWNEKGTFYRSKTTALPTVGPHMMTGVDAGNIYDRAQEEIYLSAPYDSGSKSRASTLSWEGETPFDSRLSFEVRGANSPDALRTATWRALISSSSDGRRVSVPAAEGDRWWQYKVRFHGGQAAWPTLRKVEIEFSPANGK